MLQIESSLGIETELTDSLISGMKEFIDSSFAGGDYAIRVVEGKGFMPAAFDRSHPVTFLKMKGVMERSELGSVYLLDELLADSCVNNSLREAVGEIGEKKEVELAFAVRPMQQSDVEHSMAMYQVLKDAGLNTLGAVRRVKGEEEGGGYDSHEMLITVYDEGVQTFSKTPDIYRKDSGLLKQLFQEIGKMHKARVTHKDLHGDNVAFRYNSQGRVIVFFDFETSIKHEHDYVLMDHMSGDIDAIFNSYGRYQSEEEKRIEEEQLAGLTMADGEYILEILDNYENEMRQAGILGDRLKEKIEHIKRGFVEIYCINEE